jgi:Protein of unknown function (DUF1592)/Protein of unknown function (DUF1588)/Protein of unknown function (DUF1595)/Protein of unknown function (DUF1585)/Protein of unknown function (DUF1587)
VLHIVSELRACVVRHRSSALLACAIGVSLLACSGGRLGAPSGPEGASGAPGSRGDGASPGGGTPGDGTPGGGTPGGVADGPAAFEPAPAALRKLTALQYRNTVNDLFGTELELPLALEVDTAINGFYAIGAAKATISPSAAEKFETAAYALASQALDPARRAAFVGCTPAGTVDAACTRAFLARFGLRAFRRPLGDDELARYAGIAEQAQGALGDFHAGLEFAVAGILQSPHFLFRVELGAGSGARRAYDGYEMASRLSYLLWNSTPDAALLEAARDGQLAELSGLREQAERLIESERARSALDTFHAERLALDELAALEKDPALYRGMDEGLRGALLEDVLRTIEELAFEGDGDFRALFDTRVAFVDAKLAEIYGLPAATGSARRVELPASAPRAGLLGKPAFLAANAHEGATSPTKRGKYIRERVLCESIPAPPPDVVTVLPEPNPDAPTMRDRLREHSAASGCSNCHTRMDPLGLSLEHFDAIGRYRDTDRGYALDVSGELDGERFDGALELSQLLRDDPRASACVARQLYRYAVAHVETPGEAPAVEALVGAFADSGYRFSALLRAIVVSEGFRFAGGE